MGKFAIGEKVEKILMLRSWFVADLADEKNSMISALIKLYADDLRNELYKYAEQGYPANLNSDEVYAGLTYGKLEACKQYKNRLGCSLIQAKNAVEKHFKDNNLEFGPTNKYSDL